MQLRETRTVDVPRSFAFAYTADFGNLAEWDPGVASSRRTSEGPVAEGSTFQVEAVFGSRRLPMEYRIVEYEAPTRVVLEGVGDTLTAVDLIEFSESPEGTVIDYTADLSFSGILRWVAPLMKPLLNRTGTKALDGLAATLPREASQA